ncbi:MAG TPA: sulfatase-like hydrolase/transferase, partial [Acidimicrobiales bacterium]|nr:sulfatase-like hydrolase/transferase [Acidimicrobiales bacterium]
MRAVANLLVIVLDALREDAVAPALEEPGRCFKADTAIASAPWTLPSCTSLITGLDATRHRHYWHSGALATSGLVGALPGGYRKVGLVNNTVLQPASQLDDGFDQWRYFDDHRRPFEQAAKLIGRARPRRPVFVLLHSNISHDYYLPGAGAYYDEAFPETAGAACALGRRVITWQGTTPEERVAVAKTYQASARKAVSAAREILELARGRDDFVCAVVSDHGEGLDYDGGRVHHGGRLHDDLVRVPLYFDLPSTVPERRRADLVAALAATPVAVTDVLPTLFSLVAPGSLPAVDGRPVGGAPNERVIVSE